MADYIRDPAEWPLLLVGPIVRRVTPSSVAVFVATKVPSAVILEVYEGTDPIVEDETSRVPLTGGNPGTTDTVPLGRRLHVAVVEATDLSLSPGITYGYNLLLRVGQDVHDLSLGTTMDSGDRWLPLGYDAYHLPGFMLPSTRDRLKLIHGSCRKPHGGGPDMLPLVDALISESRAEPLSRPQQLFLTGDQIYVDDVAPGLLSALTEASGLLLDWNQQELIPDTDGSATFDPTHGAIEPGSRSTFLDDQGVRKVTHYSDNHLLFYGEWCAMYVMAWSNAIWKRSDQSDHTYELAQSTSLGFLGHLHDNATREALRFAERLSHVRRALANVATYMSFDDHEITDDWYLNKDVATRLRTTPVGRRIERNGLLAYAVFQDWGNQPWDYATGTRGRMILDALRSGLPIGTGSVAAPIIQQSPDALDAVLDINPEPATVDHRAGRKRWDYAVTGPEHQVLSLDTRTWRSYPGSIGGISDDRLAAALISDDAQTLQLFDDGADAGPVVRSLSGVPASTLKLIVSPAPVIGMWLVEVLQKLKILAGPVEGTEELDNEPWAANAAAFEGLLHKLAPYSPVVFLSGDVHYAFSQVSTYSEYLPNGTPDNVARFIQLCSSSTKNGDNLTNILSVAELVTGPLKTNWYIGGAEAMQFVREQGPDLQDRLYEGVWDEWNAATDGFPDLLGLLERAWRVGWEYYWNPVYYVTKRLSDLVHAGPVAYEQVRGLKDQMWPDPSSGFTIGTTGLVDLRDPEDRDDHSPSLQQRLNLLPAEERTGILRRNAGSIGVCNMGVVTFQQDTGPMTPEWLVHTLYWRHLRHAVDPFDGAMTTEHRVEVRTPTSPADTTP